MRPTPRPGRVRPTCAAALGILLAAALTARSDPPGCLTLDRLKRMSEAELAEEFARAEVGRPPVGVARGRVVCVTDARLPRAKRGLQNAAWRGKELADDGSFVNRWAGGVRAIGSRYVIGPSWADGRPAVVMEYPPGTPLFANTRDELREVAPGLYLGPLYDRFPCPRSHFLTMWRIASTAKADPRLYCPNSHKWHWYRLTDSRR